MDNQLQSISKIFTEKLYRIPDYQRGYAWGIKQLKDYWNDILQLDEDKNHYVGVLTVESVPKEKFETWENDEWIINSKNFEPYYIVDGQQRLTTTIILLQSITEVVNKKGKLNYTTIGEIKKRYIFDSKDEGISRSYIFGYEKDNPSYEFLKSKIFLENSASGYINEETIYTQNLSFAKSFFIESLKQQPKNDIEKIFKKVTQNLLFNIYTITSDIDVFIAFETMNNRGKPLSNLELLKNRLIYLSTKFKNDNSERNQLRKNINDSWKAVYHYLGKNKNNPLNDDTFLLNHFIVYFGNNFLVEQEITWNNYKQHLAWFKETYVTNLLEEKFTIKNVLSLTNDSLKLGDVNNYIENLQESVEIWFNLFNPTLSSDYSDEEKLWLDKLSRIGLMHFAPFLLAFYLAKPKKEFIIPILKLLEKYGFLSMLFSYRGVGRLTDLSLLAHKISKKRNIGEILIKLLTDRISELSDKNNLIDEITFRFKNSGFYDWGGIRYFLFEYELYLNTSAKTKKHKIDWNEYRNVQDDYITIEHIFPQTHEKECWQQHFSKFSKKQKRALNNSLGNLLPLSKPKNSSLQNKCFLEKVDNNINKIGYRYGCLCENEISKFKEWTPVNILNRGLSLLTFMSLRWELNLETEDKKIDFLGLSFLNPQKPISTMKWSIETLDLE